MKLIACLVYPVSIIRVHDEDEEIGVLAVVAPERAELVHATEIMHRERGVLVLDCLLVEANGRDGGHDLAEFELVEDDCLARLVQPHHEHPQSLAPRVRVQQHHAHELRVDLQLRRCRVEDADCINARGLERRQQDILLGLELRQRLAVDVECINERRPCEPHEQRRL